MTHWSNDLMDETPMEAVQSGAAETVVISARIYKENSSLFLTQWFSRQLTCPVVVGALRLSQHSQKELVVTEIHGSLGSLIYEAKQDKKATKRMSKSNPSTSAVVANPTPPPVPVPPSASVTGSALSKAAPSVSYFVGNDTTLYQKYEKYRIILCLDISQSSYSASEYGLPRTILIEALLQTIDALVISLGGETNIVNVSVSVIAHRPETDDTFLVWMGEIAANTNTSILRKIIHGKIYSMELEIMKMSKKTAQYSSSKSGPKFPDIESFLGAIEYHSNLLPIEACPISFLYTTGNLNISIVSAIEQLAKCQIPLNIVVEATSHQRAAGFHADISGLALLAKSCFGGGKLVQIDTPEVATIRTSIVESLTQGTQFKTLSVFYIPYFKNARKDILDDVSSSTANLQIEEINRYCFHECTLEHLVVARIKEGFKIKSFVVESISSKQLIDQQQLNLHFKYDDKKIKVVLEKHVTKLTTLLYEVHFQQVTRKRLYTTNNYGNLSMFVEPLWLFPPTEPNLCWNRGLINVFIHKSMSSFYFGIRDEKISKNINDIVRLTIFASDKKLRDILSIPELSGNWSNIIHSESSFNLGVDLGGGDGDYIDGGRDANVNRSIHNDGISAKSLSAQIDVVEDVCRFDIEQKFLFFLRNAPKFQLRTPKKVGEVSAGFHLSDKKLCQNQRVISDIESFLQKSLPNVDFYRVRDMKWCIVFSNTPAAKSTSSNDSSSKLQSKSSKNVTPEYGIFVVKVEETHCGFVSISLVRIVKGVGSQHQMVTQICKEITNILVKHDFDPYKLSSDLSLLTLSRKYNSFYQNALSCYQSIAFTISIPQFSQLKSLLIQDLLSSKVLYSKLQLVENNFINVSGGGGGSYLTTDGDGNVIGDNELECREVQYLFLSVVVGKNPFGISKSDALIHSKVTFVRNQCEIEYFWFKGYSDSQHITNDAQISHKRADDALKQTESYIRLSVDYDRNLLLMYRYIDELINSENSNKLLTESLISHIIANCSQDSIVVSGFQPAEGSESNFYWQKLNEALIEMLFQCCSKSTKDTKGRCFFFDKVANDSLICKDKYCCFYISDFELFVLLKAPSSIKLATYTQQILSINIYYSYFPRLALGKFQPSNLAEDFLQESIKYSEHVQSFSFSKKSSFENIIPTIKKSLEQTHLNNFAKLMYFALVQNFLIHPDDIQLGLEQCQQIIPQICSGSQDVKQNQLSHDVNINSMYQELRKMFSYFNFNSNSNSNSKMQQFESDKSVEFVVKKSLEPSQSLKITDIELFLQQSFLSTMGQYLDGVVNSNLFVCNNQIQSKSQKLKDATKLNMLIDNTDGCIQEINKCEKAAFVKLTLDSYERNFTPIDLSSSVRLLVKSLIDICLSNDGVIFNDVFIQIVYVFALSEDIFTVANLKNISGINKSKDALEDSKISSKKNKSGIKISFGKTLSAQTLHVENTPSMFDNIRGKMKLFCNLNVLFAIYFNQSIKFTITTRRQVMDKDVKKPPINYNDTKDDPITTKLFYDNIRDLTNNLKYTIDIRDDIIYVLSIGEKSATAAKHHDVHDALVRATLDKEIFKMYSSEKLENGSHILRYSNPKVSNFVAWVVIDLKHVPFRFGLTKTLVDFVSSTEVFFNVQLYYFCDCPETDLAAISCDIKSTFAKICFRVNQKVLLWELNDTRDACPYLIKPLDDSAKPKQIQSTFSLASGSSPVEKRSSGPGGANAHTHNRFKSTGLQKGMPSQAANHQTGKQLLPGTQQLLAKTGNDSASASKALPSSSSLTSSSSSSKLDAQAPVASINSETKLETSNSNSNNNSTSSNSSSSESKFKKGMFACSLQCELICPLFAEAGIHTDDAIQRIESSEFAFLAIGNRELYGNVFVSKDKIKEDVYVRKGDSFIPPAGDVFYMEFDRSPDKDAKQVKLKLFAIDPIDPDTVKQLRELLENQILSLSANNLSKKLIQSTAIKPTFMSFLKNSRTKEIKSFKLSLPSYVSDIYFFCCLLRQHLVNTEVANTKILSKLTLLPGASSSILSRDASFSYSSKADLLHSNRTSLNDSSVLKPSIFNPVSIGYAIQNNNHFSQSQHLKILEEEREREKIKQMRPFLARGKKVSEIDILNVKPEERVHPAFFGLKSNDIVKSNSSVVRDCDDNLVLWDQNDFCLLYNHTDQPADESKRKKSSIQPSSSQPSVDTSIQATGQTGRNLVGGGAGDKKEVNVRSLVLMDFYPRALSSNGSEYKLNSFSTGSLDSIESDVAKLKETYMNGSSFSMQKREVTSGGEPEFSTFQSLGARGLEIVLKIYPIKDSIVSSNDDKTGLKTGVALLTEIFEQSVQQCIVTYATERLLASREFQKSVNRVEKQNYYTKKDDSNEIESALIKALINDACQQAREQAEKEKLAREHSNPSSVGGAGPISARRSNIVNSVGFAESKTDSALYERESSLSSNSSIETKLFHTSLFGYTSFQFELPRSHAINLRNLIIKQLSWLNENPNVSIIRSGFGSSINSLQGSQDRVVSSGGASSRNLRWINFSLFNDDSNDNSTIATFCYNLFDHTMPTEGVGGGGMAGSSDYRLLLDMDPSVGVPSILRTRRSVIELSLNTKGIKVFFSNVKPYFMELLKNTINDATIKAVEHFKNSQNDQLKSLGIVVDNSMKSSSKASASISQDSIANVNLVIKRLFWEQKLLNKLYKSNNSASAREVSDTKYAMTSSGFNCNYSSESALNSIKIDTWRLGKLCKTVCINSPIKIESDHKHHAQRKVEVEQLISQVVKYQIDCFSKSCKEFDIDIVPFFGSGEQQKLNTDKSNIYSAFFVIFSIPLTGSIISTELKFDSLGAFQTIVHRVIDVSDVLQFAFHQSLKQANGEVVSMRHCHSIFHSAKFAPISDAPRSVIHQIHTHPTIKKYFCAISTSIFESYRNLLFLNRRKEVVANFSSNLLIPSLISLGKVFRENIMISQSSLDWRRDELSIASLSKPTSFNSNIWLEDSTPLECLERIHVVQVSKDKEASAKSDSSRLDSVTSSRNSSLFKCKTAKGAICNHFVIKRINRSGFVQIITTGISLLKVSWENWKVNLSSDLVVETISYELPGGGHYQSFKGSGFNSGGVGDTSGFQTSIDPIEILISDEAIEAYLLRRNSISDGGDKSSGNSFGFDDSYLSHIAMDEIKQIYRDIMDELNNALLIESLWSIEDPSLTADIVDNHSRQIKQVDAHSLKLLIGSSTLLSNIVSEFSEYRVVLQAMSKFVNMRRQFIKDLPFSTGQAAELWSYTTSNDEELDIIFEPFGFNSPQKRKDTSSSDWMTEFMKSMATVRAGKSSTEASTGKGSATEIVAYLDRSNEVAILVTFSPLLELCEIYFLTNIWSDVNDNDMNVRRLSESLKSSLSRLALLHIFKK